MRKVLAGGLWLVASLVAWPAAAVEVCLTVTPERDDDGDLVFRILGAATPPHAITHRADITVRSEGSRLTCGLGSGPSTWRPEPESLGSCGGGEEPDTIVEVSVEILSAPRLTPETYADPSTALGRITGRWAAGEVQPGRALEPPACARFESAPNL